MKEIFKRRSCRKFIKKNISDIMLKRIVEAGIQAPCAANSQNYRFRIINDKEEIKRISLLKSPGRLIRSANAIIVVFAHQDIHIYPDSEKDIWPLTWSQNCSAAIQNMLLMATHYKLGSCWIAWNEKMDETRLCKIPYVTAFKISHRIDIQGLVLLGYPERIDADGYPLGDFKHGGNLVKRRDIKYYLI